MKVHTLISDDYGENTYIAETGSNKAVIIDPGAVYESIKELLDTNCLLAEYVFLTHGHYDHIISAHNFSPLKIYAHISEKELIQTPAYNLSSYMSSGIALSNINYVEGEDGFLNGFRYIHTPGHTGGCMILIKDGCLFSGDTLFYDTVGRTDLPSGNPRALKESLKVFDKLDKDLLVYPGHGEPFKLIDAYKYNYFLR